MSSAGLPSLIRRPSTAPLQGSLLSRIGFLSRLFGLVRPFALRRPFTLFQVWSSSRRLALFLPCALLLIFAHTVVSQSGRRLKVPAPSTSATSNQTSENDGSKSEGKKITILVGRQPTSKRLLSEDTIYAAFVTRLNEQKSVEAIPIGDLTKRDQAVKQARGETTRFVVLLQLEI